MKQVKDNNTLNEQLSEEHEYESENISKCTLMLPYAGEKGCTLVRSLQRQQKSSLPGHYLFQYKTFVLFQHERRNPI